MKYVKWLHAHLSERLGEEVAEFAIAATSIIFLVCTATLVHAFLFTQTTETDFAQGEFSGTQTDGNGNVVLMATSTYDGWPAGDVQVASSTTHVPDEPLAISDGSGGMFVLWTDDTPHIYAQRIDSSGHPLWTIGGITVATLVNNNSNFVPYMASDNAGGIIVAWRDPLLSSGTMHAQRVSASGSFLWGAGVTVGDATSSVASDPTIISDGAGGAFISWSDNRNVSPSRTIDYAQHIDSTGARLYAFDLPLAFLPTAVFQNAPTLTSDGNGGFIAAWKDDRNFSQHSYDIYGQRVSSTSTLMWGTAGAAIATSSGRQEEPVAVSDGSGGAIVAWNDYRNGSIRQVFAQDVGSTSMPQWTIGGLSISNTPGSSFGTEPVGILSDGSGGAIITWIGGNTTFGDQFIQRLSSSGSLLWGAAGVNLSNDGENSANSGILQDAITLDGSGGAIVVWTDCSLNATCTDLFVQKVNSSGAPQWLANGIPIVVEPQNQQNPWIVSDGSGGALMVWNDHRNHDINSEIDLYAQRILSNAATTSVYPSSGLYAGTASSTGDVDWSQQHLTYSATTPSDSSISFQTRILWTDEFSSGDSSEVVNDIPDGCDAATTTETGGILTFSNIPVDVSSNGCIEYLINTGKGTNFYPAGSIVRARVRVRGADAVRLDVSTDEFSGNEAETTDTSGNWVDLQFTQNTAFTNVALYADSYTTIDGIDVDYVQVEPPLDFIDWDDVTGTNINSGTGEYLQYKATFTPSTDALSTPSLDSVSITVPDVSPGGGGGSGGGGSTATFTGGGYYPNSGTATTSTNTVASTTATTTTATYTASTTTTTTTTAPPIVVVATTTTPQTIEATTTPPTECAVKTAAEWATTAQWPNAALPVGNETFTQAQLKPVLLSNSTNPSMVLAKQFIAAMLNYEEGATPSPDLAAAQKWMQDNDTNPAYGLNYYITNSLVKPPALALAAKLQTYNQSGNACELKTGETSLTLSCDAPLSTTNPDLATSSVAYGSFASYKFSNGLLQNLHGALTLPSSLYNSGSLLARALDFIDHNRNFFGLPQNASVADSLRVAKLVAEPDSPPPTPSATIDAGAGNGVTLVVPVGTPVTIHATFTILGRTDALAATAINNDNTGANSVSCDGGDPYCWTTATPSKTYTFEPIAVGTTTFSAQIQAKYFKPVLCKQSNCYDSYATVSVVAVLPIATSTATTTDATSASSTSTATSTATYGGWCTDKMCGIPCEDGYSLDSTSGICTHNFVQTASMITASELPTATIDAGAGNGVTMVVKVGTPVTVHATFAPPASAATATTTPAGGPITIAATAINNDTTGNGNSVKCAGTTSGSKCWALPEPEETYTFTPNVTGTATFSAQIKADHYVPALCTHNTCYDSYATVTVIAVATSTATSTLDTMCTDKMCGIPCEDGYSLDSTSGICTHNFVQSSVGVAATGQPSGRKNVTFQRYIQGLPVIGTSLNMTLTGATSSPGAVINSIISTLPATDAITNAVLLTPEQAIAKALAGTSATEATATLAVFNAGLMRDNECQTSNRIVYQVTLLDGGPDDPGMRVIDPGHGAILFDQASAASEHSFTAWQVQTGTTKPVVKVYTRIAQDPICPDKGSTDAFCTSYASALSTSPPAVKLYNTAIQAYNYFLKKFNRAGFDGVDSHVGLYWERRPLPNPGAQFDYSGSPQLESKLLVYDLNVIQNSDFISTVIHEIGHGVMFSSGVYMQGSPAHGEAESIGEGMADAFAFWAKGSYNMWTPNGVRDAVPTLDWSNSGDPHIAGLRLGHVAYTAAYGGSGTDENGDPVTVTPGPGGENAVAQIFYDTIYTGKIAGYPNWEELSQATIDDASDASDENDPHTLNGQAIDPHDCGAVMNAWAAVGMGEGDRDNDCVVDLQDDCPDEYDPKQDGTCCPKYLDVLKKNGADIAEAEKECNKDPGTPPGIKRNAPTGGGGITPGHWETYSGVADSGPYGEGSLFGNIYQALGFLFSHLECLVQNWGVFTGNYPAWSCSYWVFSDISSPSGDSGSGTSGDTPTLTPADTPNVTPERV